MHFENEGIRHIEIQSKGKNLREQEDMQDYEVENRKLQQKHLLDGDSDQVNLDSLLKAVIDISDRLHDQEEKLKQNEVDWGKFEYNQQSDEEKRSSFPKKQSVKHQRSRPKTAVLKYTKADSFSSDSDLESSKSSLKDFGSVSSVRSRAVSNRHAPTPVEPHSTNKLSMTFSNHAVKTIDMENQRLLKELLRTKARSSYAKNAGPVRVQSAAAINRRRKQQEIERENLRLLNRLQSVKPTSNLSRDKLLRDHMKTEQCSDRLSKTARKRPQSAPVACSITKQSINSREGSVLNFDNDSVSSSSRLSVLSFKNTPSRASSAGTKKQRKVKVEEYWEPGW